MGAPSIFPKPIQEFIQANFEGLSNQELTDRVNATFGTAYTCEQIKSYGNNRGLHKGLRYLRKFSETVEEFIIANHSDFGCRVMAKKVNAAFGTSYTPKEIQYYYRQHNLSVSEEVRHKAPDTAFKKGHLPAKAKPLGYERFGAHDYIEVKVRQRPNLHENDHFAWKHHLVWEHAHGPIPEGSVLIFLDGDKTNCALENLQLVSRAEQITLLNHHLRFSDPELTRSGALVAKVVVAVNEKKKSVVGKAQKKAASDDSDIESGGNAATH